MKEEIEKPRICNVEGCTKNKCSSGKGTFNSYCRRHKKMRRMLGETEKLKKKDLERKYYYHFGN